MEFFFVLANNAQNSNRQDALQLLIGFQGGGSITNMSTNPVRPNHGQN